MIIALERFIPWLDSDNMPTQRMATFMEDMTRVTNLNTPIVGTGSPEGVVEAKQTQMYMDDAGTSETILYIKKSLSGDTGWVLI